MPENHPVAATIIVRNDLSEIQRVGQMITNFVTAHHLPLQLIMDFTLVAEEVLTNVISYGFDDEKTHFIQLQMEATANEIVLTIEDDGRAYNPLSVPTPDVTAALQDRPLGGLGIYLVRQLMDHLDYRREANKNGLTMKKRIPQPKGNETDEMH